MVTLPQRLMNKMNIYQKLIEVRKAVPYLKKEAKSQQYNYTASSQVLASVREKLDELNLLLVPRVLSAKVEASQIRTRSGTETTNYFTELHMEMTWINADNPEETIVCPWYGQGVDLAGEKGVGKALTYAEKYFMLKFFNIPTDQDDPDRFEERHYSETNTNTNNTPVPIPKGLNDQKDELISKIAILCSEKDLSPEWLKNSLEASFKKGELKELTMSELNRTIAGLERR